MQEFFESGKTIIYVSHSSGEINRLCTRAIMLHDGKILMDGEPKEITKQYEKYLFSKDENKQSIIDEIKKQNIYTPIKIHSLSKDFLIPDFESKNRVEYDDTFLKIDNIYMENMDREKVNVLITNERYFFYYRLTFLKDFNNVDFGMQIHSEKGILITGCKQKKSLNFKADETVEIRWEFDCLMHEGIYYTSIGVNYLHNGDREYINRIVDASVFKVLKVDNCCNGLLYLKQSEPRIIRDNKASS